MKKIKLIAYIIVATTSVTNAGGFNPGGGTPGSGSGNNGSIPVTGAPDSVVPFNGGLSIILLAFGTSLGAKSKKSHRLCKEEFAV